MRHTLRQDGQLWHWSYTRRIDNVFSWSGVSWSRKAAIRSLLEARQEARDCAMTMEKWRATWPTAA